jgi:peptidoglycan/LPS O-acetylase OafA/YrhL
VKYNRSSIPHRSHTFSHPIRRFRDSIRAKVKDCIKPMNRPVIEKLRYRPEIDGLRAIAVLAVVLFHSDLGAPGGFVGVDVFFVISGFLITSLILRDLEAGTFTLANFWERRARRILPAAVVMVLAVLTAGWFLLLPSDYAKLGQSAVWQAIFGANIYFWRTINYFGGPAEEQVLLHTWSLAVEEQFYMIVPLVLMLLFRFPAFRRRGIMFAFLGGGLIGSLGISAVLLPRMPVATFYLLPTRAWEMLCGSLIAVAPVPRWVDSRVVREAFCGIGLAAILIPCFIYTENTLFPGFAAVPPCLGTAFFIWAASPMTNDNALRTTDLKTLTVLVLSSRPFVFIGLISYSLYLWHWPLFAFDHYWALEPRSVLRRISLMVAGLILSLLSWRYVETPFRTRVLGASRRSLFQTSLAGVATCLITALVIWWQLGIPLRVSPQIQAYDIVQLEASERNSISSPTSLQDAVSQRLPRLGAPVPAPVSLLVWGDSHSRAIMPGVEAVARDHGVGVMSCWNSSTPPVLDYIPRGRFSLGKDAPKVNLAIFHAIKQLGIKRVMMVARWSGYFDASTRNAETESSSIRERLIETVQRLNSSGVEVFILMEVPRHSVSIPRALASRGLFQTNIASKDGRLVRRQVSLLREVCFRPTLHLCCQMIRTIAA